MKIYSMFFIFSCIVIVVLLYLHLKVIEEKKVLSIDSEDLR